jgi:PleD family two-component response regulator
MDSPDALYEAADKALFLSKRAGRNRVTLHSAPADA